MNKKALNIVVSGWEYGAGKSGTSQGPDALLHALEKHTSLPTPPIKVAQTVEAEDVEHIYFPHLKRARHLLRHQARLANTIENLAPQTPTLLLTGDHSNAIGGIAGFCRNRDTQNVGIIWIDAHLDLHSPYTTPSGNIHGMSVNTAIEFDNLDCQVNDLDADCISLWKEIKNLKKSDAVKPENIVFLGIRSYEIPEMHLIKTAGIKVIFAEDIHKNGIEWALNEIQIHFQNKAQEWYVSFDVDSMDPSVSIGTGTPVAGGLSKRQAQTVLEFFWNQDQTQLLEITEINPSLDTQKPMAEEVSDLLCRLLIAND